MNESLVSSASSLPMKRLLPTAKSGKGSTPASAEVAARIRDAILGGDVPLGSPITERWISEQYTVSRTTAHDVLQLLVSERYLERRPYRSANVRTFNEKDMQDNLNARLLIECAGARACPGASAEQVRQLQASLTAYCDALDGGERVAATDAHRDLHIALAAMTGNNALIRFESELMLDASLFLDVIDVQRADIEKMRTEHVRLAEAFLGGDAELAEKLVRAHLRMVTSATKTLKT